MERVGVLLLQLGTPGSASIADVRSYLREFLSDPRVLDMPALARNLLLYGVILPFRPRKAAHAYRQIWTEEGSPLTLHSQALASKVRVELGDCFRVEVAMRYKDPSITDAVEKLRRDGCERFVVFPLFPQYSSSASASATQEAFKVLSALKDLPQVTAVEPFYGDTSYLDALAEVTNESLLGFGADHVLFSFHGLPEKHIHRKDGLRSVCLASNDCCSAIDGSGPIYCYRSHCFQTTKGVVERLGLGPDEYSVAFQSRLAGQQWLRPYTDHRLVELYNSGVRRLAVATPAFTADCLETLEEIGIRARQQWADLGGEELLLVPCLNSDDRWARAVAKMAHERAPVGPKRMSSAN